MAQSQFFEVVERHGNLTLQHLIEVEESPVPGWVWRIAKPFLDQDGKPRAIPPDRPIFRVNVAAEMRERAEHQALAAAQAPSNVCFEEPDVIVYLRQKTGQPWSQEDFDQRSALHPKFPTGRYLGGGYGSIPTGRVGWFQRELDQWITESRDLVVTLTRLVGGKPNGRR